MVVDEALHFRHRCPLTVSGFSERCLTPREGPRTREGASAVGNCRDNLDAGVGRKICQASRRVGSLTFPRQGTTRATARVEAVPVAFDCSCGIRWWSPPDVACLRCGHEMACEPDPIVWSIGQVPGTSVFISAQMRDDERFAELVGSGIERFVDVAGGAPYVWRPDAGMVRSLGVRYLRIDGVEDLKVDLPDFAFDAAAAALEEARRGISTLFFCAAGLKRSPHLLYGVLRSWGYDAKSAWDAVTAARPFVDPWDPYLASAERWLADRNARQA